ncbi:MAG TPA: leucyl/phenylalanyl-tRNA--protein transferase, partial [Polyangiaceae bacterium]|nr:leucyl/phenylalanyl-tRNA--protein transferase [Polyangiaceae bacterium]
EFHPRGIVAGGGDLSPARLLAAYRAGIFPWYDQRPILWWSPDPRAIITQQTLHVSRSLKRRLVHCPYAVTCNRDPEAVLDGCADRAGGTWLDSDMRAAYLRLFDAGHLLSFEVWQGALPERKLVGGLYGVLVDGLFAAESKFHRATDASKLALVCAVSTLFARGLRLFDVQFTTEHLLSLGVFNVSRDEYLDRLAEARTALVVPPETSTDDLVPEVVRSLYGSGHPEKQPA